MICLVLCFQADDPKEAAKDILARAAARGIITGVNTESKDKNKPVKPQANTPRIEKKKSSDKKQGNTPASTPGRPITVGSFTVTPRPLNARMTKTVERLSRPKTSPGMESASLNSFTHVNGFNLRSNNSATPSDRWRKLSPIVPPHRQVTFHVTPFR